MQIDIWPEDQTRSLPVKCCQSSKITLPWSKKNWRMIVWSNQAYKLKKAIVLSHHELHVRTDEKQANKLIGYKKANDFCPNLN